MNKLHVGCGPIYLSGWFNVDIAKEYTTDACGDILKMHFDDMSFDAIFSCHFFEHLSYPVDAMECLKRFYRWLRPDGILRLAVPDLQLAVNDYVSGGDLKFIYGSDFKGFYYKDVPSERLNFFIKAWGHQMCYDYRLLKNLLEETGFEKIYKAGPNQSQINSFTHDRFISESLYVEAIK